MLRLVTSPKNKKSCSVSSLPSEYCHDDKPVSCCPWRMPRPNIPAAVRSFQIRLRASTSLTSQSRPASTSRSLFSLFRKRHSTPVIPFYGKQDHGVTCVKELRGSKSVGAVTDHFARIEVGAQKGETRSIPSRSSQQGSEQESIKCVFSLPGAVIDEVESISCPIDDGISRVSCHSEMDTNKAKPGSINSNETAPCHVHGDEKTFAGQAAPAHEVNILVINHSDEKVKQGACVQDVQGESPELTLVEKFTLSPSSSDDEMPTEDAVICKPECSMDNDLKDTTGKPDMDIVASPCENVKSQDILEDHGEIDRVETCRDVKIPYADEDSLEDEIRYFDKTSEEGDDDNNLEDLLDRCPKSEVIRNLRSAVDLSKCATRQLERALKKWSRLSQGPFPREPGKYKTKAEVVDDKTLGLRSETARYLGEMNKVFFNFYCVTEQLDDIEERQERLVDSIKANMKSPSPAASPMPAQLPKQKQELADLYLDNRAEGPFQSHKVKVLLGSKIPPTIAEEEDE